jgi:hypothetical protein
VTAPGARLAISRILVIVAVLAMTGWLTATPSFASHGTAPSGWPDNGDQYVDRNSITAKSEIAVTRGIAQLNRSDLYATLNGSSDIEVFDGDFGDTGWDGRTDCIDKIASTWLWSRKCDVFSIKFNQHRTDGYSAAQMQTLGCHEFGHTAGLDHRSASNDGQAVSCRVCCTDR